MLPSRLIPGMPTDIATAMPKKTSAAIWNQPSPGSDPVGRTSSDAGPGIWQMLSQSILPTPATANERVSLAIQVLSDFVLVSLSFAVRACFAVLLNKLFRHASAGWQSPSFPSSTFGLLLLYGAIFTLLGYSERLYHPELAQAPRRQTLVLARVVFWTTGLMFVGLLVSGMTAWAVATLAAAPIVFASTFVYRQERRRALARQARSGRHSRNVLIVGAGPVGRRLAHALQRDHAGNRVVCGFLDEKQPLIADVLGRVEDLETVAHKQFVDEIILAVPAHSEAARQAIWQARRNHIDVKLVPDVMGADPARITLQKFGDMPLLNLWEEPVPVFHLLLKRSADVLLSGVGLLLTSPLLAAIAIAIKLDSRGPVLYLANRTGLKGRQFPCCKFRTMVAEADQLKEKLRARNQREGAFFKIIDDPRITRVGKFLRRYSLDELPQLWNVLRGDMSLVGPRPHPIDDVQRYRVEDFQRLQVTPGLTGLWQVTARRDPSFERSVALDREYIGHWSLAMDFRIMCKTVSAVLRGQGV